MITGEARKEKIARLRPLRVAIKGWGPATKEDRRRMLSAADDILRGLSEDDRATGEAILIGLRAAVREDSDE